MHKRIAVVLCGLILAVVGAPAAPALAAAGVTCGNITDYGETPEPIIIARTCIAWDDLPAGNRWTLHQSKIWNPPVAPTLTLYVNFFYNHSGHSADSAEVLNNETEIRNAAKVGPYTAKFEVFVPGSNVPYCMYMIPRSYTQVRGRC